MEKFEIGMLSVSRAGHDIGNVYVIIKADNEYVYLVDGKIRTLDRPKKKNIKHIQIIKKTDEDLLDKIKSSKVQNEDIKRAIKLYNNKMK